MKYDEFKEKYIVEKSKRKPRHIEGSIQTACVTWFRSTYKSYLCFACPNGGSRNPIEAINMKKSGVLPGVSDLIIVANQRVLFVEMKTKTGRQSENQKLFQSNVERLGFEYKICRSFISFQTTVEKWLNSKSLE